MSSTSAVAAQWSLNETANDFLGTLRGLMVASSSDNVQPLALRACEQYGMTLPVCLETRLKIEKLARPRRTSHTLRFIQAKIGYAAGDATEFLSQTEGGIRFLCLAAALQSVTLPFTRAQIMETLLRTTAFGDEPRPTLGQLKDVFVVLEAKLSHSDFTTSVFGWHIWQMALIDELQSKNGPMEFHLNAEPSTPSPAAVESLVSALSTCCRLGEICTLRIACASDLAPWIFGFIKWLTGQVPELHLCEDKQNASPICLHSEPNSQIFLRQDDSLSSNHVSIRIEQDVGDIKSLLNDSSVNDTAQSPCAGLLNVYIWAEMRLCMVRAYRRVDKKYVAQVMYSLAIDLLDKYKPFSRPHFLGTVSTRYFYPLPFSSTEIIVQFLQHLFQFDPYTPGDDHMAICDIVSEINNFDQRPSGFPDLWLERIGKLTADALCLSLFGVDLDSPLFPKLEWRSFSQQRMPWGDRKHEDDFTAFQAWIEHIHADPAADCTFEAFAIADLFLLAFPDKPDKLPRIENLGYSFRSIYTTSLNLLGHPLSTPSMECLPIISSAKGQVVYPRLLEDLRLSSTGFLDLLCFPGQLSWDNASFPHAKAGHSWEPRSSRLNSKVGPTLTPLLDSLRLSTSQRAFTKWRVTAGDGFLDASIVSCIENLQTGHLEDGCAQDGWSLISRIAKLPFSLPCSHSETNLADTSLAAIAQVFDLAQVSHSMTAVTEYTSHWVKSISKNAPISHILVPTHGNDAQRFAILARLPDGDQYSEEFKVPPSFRIGVHDQGCIACAISALQDNYRPFDSGKNILLIC
ncbi:hypothetical protein MMC20_000012 [Loxospora ochrophaea]|nr:hypothetical protein [Loxospora ochrophaea]